MVNKLTDIFSGQMLLLSCLYFSVFVAVILDLWSGIRKAARRGDFRSSYGLRKTVEKLAKYLNLMLVLTVIDSMQMIAVNHINPQIGVNFPLIPVLSIAGAIFLGIIEFKSIYEKADEKERGKFEDAAKLAGKIMRDQSPGSLADGLARYLKSNEEKKMENGD